jgi:hypothetical protein
MAVKDVDCSQVPQRQLYKASSEGLSQVLSHHFPGVVDVLCAWVRTVGRVIVSFSYGMPWLGSACSSLAQLFQGSGISGRPQDTALSHVPSGLKGYQGGSCEEVHWQPQGFTWGVILLLLAAQLQVAVDLDTAGAHHTDWKPANVLVVDPTPLQRLNRVLLQLGAALQPAAAAGTAAEAAASTSAAAAAGMGAPSTLVDALRIQVPQEYKRAREEAKVSAGGGGGLDF